MSALKGIVLEELLAGLLRDSGYDLLVDPSQDPHALCAGANGLRVRGRGADHQADVLGQLQLEVMFTFPIRLFVEAKFRGPRTGLLEVRNAVGVIDDVNEHYSRASARAVLPEVYRRFHYRYALFSASGFTEDAQRYAISHQISLIDLRGPAFAWLLRAAIRLADALMDVAVSAGLNRFPVAQAREALRRAFGTWTSAPASDSNSFAAADARARSPRSGGQGEAAQLPPRALARIASQAADQDGRLYWGVTASPFLLVLSPDDSDDMVEFLEARTGGTVDVRFAGASEEAGDWTVTVGGLPSPLTLRFGLPALVEALVLGEAEQIHDGRSTLDERMGRRRSRKIGVVVGTEQVDLAFEPVALPVEADEGGGPPLRRSRFSSELQFRDEEREDGPSAWSQVAMLELLRRLRSESWPHADIIEWAARHGGSASREDVYRIAEYSEDRMLRGFTRPPRRITRNLIREGILPSEAGWPLVTNYRQGVLASHFTVPPGFVSFFN